LEPRRQLEEPVLERYLRLVAQQIARQTDVREAAADIANPVHPRDLGAQVPLPEELCHLRGQLPERDTPTAPDIEASPRRSRDLERQEAGPSDVVHTHEIPTLPTILEDQRAAIVEQAGGKDRQHTRIRIRQRLPAPVDVEEAQRDRI